ncbi:MAG: shikimate kinase [Candidatus Eremiobacteraeota bacterium]|nr:shikimate kinase [Candidatus Eremiobacteraeota bacterium]MBC5827423.1 shikimate kinase [Candidatus Eremiobacteraeota bacterium]
MILALTGFMGAGKSTVGRRLAKILHLQFRDSDALIERRHGPISAIFAGQGEAKFRAYERDALEMLVRAGPCVLAVGGGAIVARENRALLRRHGKIVHLSIRPETALARVARRRQRPLFGSQPRIETVLALMRARAAAYGDSDFCIAADAEPPSAIARAIADWYAADTAAPSVR